MLSLPEVPQGSCWGPNPVTLGASLAQQGKFGSQKASVGVIFGVLMRPRIIATRPPKTRRTPSLRSRLTGHPNASRVPGPHVLMLRSLAPSKFAMFQWRGPEENSPLHRVTWPEMPRHASLTALPVIASNNFTWSSWNRLPPPHPLFHCCCKRRGGRRAQMEVERVFQRLCRGHSWRASPPHPRTQR